MLAQTIYWENNIIPFSRFYAKKTALGKQESISWLPSPIPLLRKGSLISSEEKKWNIIQVTEILSPQVNQEFFSMQINDDEALIVSRKLGEKGMKEIFLVAISRTYS